MLEQMLITILFFPHILHFWNNLPLSVVCTKNILRKLYCRTFSKKGSVDGDSVIKVTSTLEARQSLIDQTHSLMGQASL